MAAYASVISLAQAIQHFLHHEHLFPRTYLVGELQNIKSFQDNVDFLQAFLDDSPDNTTTELEGRIRDASNEAEDLIEYLMLGSADLHKLSFKLRKAAQKISSIVREVTDIKNNTTRVKYGDSSSTLPPSTTARDNIVVGLDEDLLAIKKRLWGASGLEIIPICGMGGIGKTTLARNAYEYSLTTNHFDIRGWVTVSQDYKAEDVLSRLKDSMKASVEGQSGRSGEAVHKSLKGKRYLIVLDDMWSTDVWDDVMKFFPKDNNGSRIMLTTRLADVATYANSSSHLHQMRLMDGDRSWQLLQQKVFNKQHCPPQLAEIGRTIAGNCKGLPLAIIVVAGILSTINRTEASWENVSKVISTFTANDDKIAKIFSLSYTHLPHHLRPCLLYMGCFPEDHDIHISKLVKLWTAEGFMKPTGGSKSCEEVGEVYLEDLVKRSLVFVARRRKLNGKIKSCSIHDLLRDLCIRKAKEEKFLRCPDTFISYRRCLTSRRNLNPRRRVSVGEPGILFKQLNLLPLCGPTVHSILFYGCQQLSCLTKFKLLRVLDATKIEFGEFPDNVRYLCLLRYLAFHLTSKLEIVDVPPMSKLRNLQTLLISVSDKNCREEIRLKFPLEFWSMRRLRHLHVVGNAVVHLPEPCSTAFPLLDLQTLATVTDFRCTEGVWQMIPNLKKLGIIYDFDESDEINWDEYHLDNLVHLRFLEELSIRVNIFTLRHVPMWGEPQFPGMLKKLKLENLRLSQKDMEIIGQLSNLEVLKLIRCFFEDCTWETTDEELPKLKVLKMSDTNLKKWTTESSCFPSLNHLHLCHCSDLDEIPKEIGENATLDLIEVRKGNKSLVESAERIKREQQSYGNYYLQVRVLKW